MSGNAFRGIAGRSTPGYLLASLWLGLRRRSAAFPSHYSAINHSVGRHERIMAGRMILKTSIADAPKAKLFH
jgi:hypothetical protein